MTSIMEELKAASLQLQVALKRYTSACAAVQGCYIRGNIISKVLQDHSACISDEIQQASSYQTEIQQAKAALSLSRNCASTATPINTLPSELLGRIFQSLLNERSCNLCKHKGLRSTRQQTLDRLLQVCTRWRQFVITTPNFWSHIDLVPCCGFSKRFFSRAETCIIRARQSLLDLHIININHDPRRRVQIDYSPLTQFLAPITARIRSLTLSAQPESHDSADFYRCILQGCFSGTSPGTLAQITIENLAWQSPNFISDSGTGTTHMDHRGGLLLGLSRAHYESIWLPIKILRLSGLFPCWRSVAYQGLVELHLTCGWIEIPIPETELVNILKASPALQVFYFGLKLTDLLPEDGPILPVRLQSLVTLHWLPKPPAQPGALGNFLRWLAPGSNPLQLSIRDEPQSHLTAGNNSIDNFFTRSRITKFHSDGWRVSGSSITALLERLPSLQILVIHKGLSHLPEEPDEDRTIAISTPFRLASLHLVKSFLSLDALKEIAKRRLVQTLVLWYCDISHQNPQEHCSAEEAKRQVQSVCPDIQIRAYRKGDPIMSWDLDAVRMDSS